MPSPTERAAHRTPPAALGAFPDLFVDYCTDFDAVADFYPGDWQSRPARRAAATAAAKRPADREVLADTLLDQNERWGLDERTRSHIETLRDPDSIAVVTGQQVGLFTGPLYTIYKTITTLQLIEEWADQTGRPVVPVFWVEGEDHDFEEIAAAHVLQHNEVVPLSYEPGVDDNPGAVGRLALTDGIQDVVDRLDEALPPSDFKPAVMEQVRAAYQPGTRLEDAFARLMRSLFEDDGLVFMNPDDARLKALTRPLFRRDIEDPRASVAPVNAAGRALRDRDYHAQVNARPTNLFWLGDDGRWAIDLEDENAFRLRGTDRTFSRSDLLNRLDETPERFSPNVVLRPLMQDHLLPTAAYVAGPGEVSYFAQYGGVYDWADLDMPLIHPRASVSLVEGKVQKVLDKYGLTVADFRDGLEPLFQDVVVDTMEVDVDALFSEALPQLHQTLNALKPEVEAVDRTLGASTEATRSAIMDEMEALKQKVVRAEKRQQDEVRAQLKKAHTNLRPDGTLQERTINVLYYLNKYSPALLDDLRHALRTDTSAHQVVGV
ncbi:bacillithiol biosynthesis cysteine-adding enzyme BshC [Salinibacter ruber]|jgi:bacillithiol biosynthesis cysteine-adding enzyme BshC|uniref:Putative cysteine ligase BshC n=2 Tax=Salinibacter ruber TaxID=146919 RepID=A0A9X2PWJ0_9BACT|nr:bacillithiol biosynthesis cysteine-adding enzyme BshC [Salinibacter ruber]MCS3611159.1 bacillithiol biosynthesis cysteine-adding enzyme BshC [Salinibacter ruber]MCS3614473.1 bacillithiol biosynthesis cysteine-adding enzyme BshC [Salinibacter ruber]MCS3628416.1 bacillithiol biosynthesis cysteine-adding enzyme BshC [Salinibacter ruber]MCS3646269.1 bacillithiol biosynthesis cysteine-adding enzyme BshC [Salinibacter ruber]MCS3657508.1 bacillithiol biosynthesis cysteine-adding enzyme BshC [Salin